MRLRRPLTAQVVGAFLAARADLAPATLGKYRWIFGVLAEAHHRLPDRALEIEQLLAAQGHHAPATRDTFWRAYQTLYRWAALHLGVNNPMPAVRRTRQPTRVRRTLTDHQLERLLALPLSRRDRALLQLFLDTGLRLGEVAGLTWPDVRGDHLLVTGKCGERIVPVSPSTVAGFVGLGDGRAIWVGRQGPLTPSGVRRVVRRVLAMVGVAGGPHTLRHTVGREWLRNGGDLRSLQFLLGHTKIQTTALYAALDTRDLHVKHALFSPVARAAAEGA